MSETVERVARAMWAARLERRGYSPVEARRISSADELTGDELAQARAAIVALREATPVVRDADGYPAHQLVGAPEDIWRTMVDALLTP